MAFVPTCLLIRHGRTATNANGTLAGWTEGVGLDEKGRSQVVDLAERLRGLPVRAVVSSPLQRCIETAQILVATLGDVTVETDERVGECRYGSWTGGSLKDLAKEPLWRMVQDQPSAARFPDGDRFAGESIAEMQARALRTVREIDVRVGADFGTDSLWVLVSHGDVIKSILADAAGAHLDHFQRFVVGPASLSVVTYTERRPFLVRVNDSGAALASLVPPVVDGADSESPHAHGHDGAAPSGDAAIGGGDSSEAVSTN